MNDVEFVIELFTWVACLKMGYLYFGIKNADIA